MISKEELKSIPRMNEQLEHLKNRLQELNDIATTVQGVNYDERVQTSGDANSMNTVDMVLDQRLRIEKLQDKIRNVQKEALKIFRLIDDPVSATIMEMRYLDMKEWDDISSELNYSKRHVLRLHGEVLNEFF